MDTLFLLGIYPDAIKNAADICKTIIDESSDIINNYGTDEEKNMLSNIDLEEDVIDKLNETINVHDMTNCIISAYFDTVTSVLNSCNTLADLDIGFHYYVNCDDSHICIDTKNGTRNYSPDELKQIVLDAQIKNTIGPLYDLIKKYFDITNKEYPLEYIEEDLQHGDNYDIGDAILAIETKTLPDHIIAYINSNISENSIL